MMTRLIRVEDAYGIRIPEALIEAAGLDGPLQLRVVAAGLLIQRTCDPRPGWAADAGELQGRSDGGPLDPPSPTSFDESEWVWE